ncbi:SpvB/TcaC N-terminal domain-containing protein [Shewanella sp. YLB-07]|uniref:SpvB/TcaC N-terminal domain-containing protein n=1 Tax=Shewanella sp. YLB-07 TaxID=2601268 RepID=UPI001883EAF5|nr:SpvB/TcaC N-terminal domain-containing protein [Shewanella sp. YLB-07]
MLSVTPATHLALEYYDIDGDGVLDIFIRDSSSYRDSFIITNLLGTANVDPYSDSRNGIDLSQGTPLTITDVNGDGINDIVTPAGTYLGSRAGTLVSTSPAPDFSTPGNVIGLSAGEFKVTEAGAATYTIPLSLPPGTSGVVPQVSLAYSSQGGGDILGVGWSISGLSAISRCPKNLPIDGILDGIHFNAADSYCLNGQRLMFNANSSDEYHTEIDNFSVIKAYSGTNGPEYFTVTTQANEVHYYGKAPAISAATDAYIERGGFPAGSAASAWAIKAIVDHKGNYIRYDYDKDTAAGSHLLSSIAYGGNVTLATGAYNHIEFNYIDAAKPWLGFAHGGVVSRNKQLEQIIVKQDADVFRNYQLMWSRTVIPEERDYVTGIQECFDTNAAHCLPATTFAFAQPSRKSSTAILYQPFDTTTRDIVPSNANRSYAQVADFNGNGYADMLVPNGNGWAMYSSAWRMQSGGVSSTSHSDWKQGYLSQHPVARTIKRSVVSDKYETVAGSRLGEKGYAKIIDFDGDGKNDLLIPFASGDWHIITLNPGTRETLDCEPDVRGGQHCVNTDVSYDFVYTSLNISSAAYKDTIGDGLHDIVFKQGKDLFYYQNLGGSFLRRNPSR